MGIVFGICTVFFEYSALLFSYHIYQIFEDGINEPGAENGMVSKWAVNRNYLVSPINGVLKYHRLGNQERNDAEVPFEKASLVLSDVSLTITEVLVLFPFLFAEGISEFILVMLFLSAILLSYKSCVYL